MHASRRRRVAYTLAALIFIASLAANFELGLAVHEAFAKIQFARIFPLGYGPEEPRGGAAPAQGQSISFWGDSRALMWDKSALADILTVRDYSHGATTSSQLALQLQTQTAMPSDYAVVQIGINDLHPLGALRPYNSQIREQLKKNVFAIRDALLERSKVIVLTTVFPPAHIPLSRRTTWDPNTLRYIDEINDVLRESADGKRVILLDAHALLSDGDSFLNSQFVDDDFFLHVNRRAYSRLNERLRKMVLENRLPAGN